MKTPSSLLLLPLLLAALPALADVKPPARCDSEFLAKVINDFAKGGVVVDADRIDTKTVDGVTIPVLKMNSPKTCDAGTWNQLSAVSATEGVWRSQDASRFWQGGRAPEQAALLLVVDDAYRVIDPKGQEALAAADAVIDAAEALGLAKKTPFADSQLAWLAANSGGPFAALKPTNVEIIEKKDFKGGTVGGDTAGPAWRKVLDNTGAANAGGSEVLRFRVGVLQLGAALGNLGHSTALVKSRLGKEVGALRDLTANLPRDYQTPKADAATAIKDEKFKSALDALIGAGTTPSLDDKAAREGAALESVDRGLRNLLAIRAAQIDKIVVRAKEQIAGTTIAEIEASARAGSVGAKTPEHKLGAAVLSKLSQTPEYIELNSMYDNSKADQTPAGKARTEKIAAARESMEAAALSATVSADPSGVKSVQFTQNGGVVKPGIVPAVAEGEDTRGDAAAVIARFIVSGAQSDAKYQAALAAIRGSGQPGGSLESPLKAPEVAVGNQVPPALKDIKAGAAGGCDPRDLARNDHETYAARQRAAANDIVAGNRKSREEIQDQQKSALADAETICAQELSAANAITRSSDFESEERFKGRVAAAKAEAEKNCGARKKVINDKATAALDAAKEADAKSKADAVIAAADAKVDASFKVAIGLSVENLRADYVKKGSLRQLGLIEAAKLSGPSDELVIFIHEWFDTNWPRLTEEQKNKADDIHTKTFRDAVNACAAKLGLGTTIAGKKNPSYKNPESMDNIDKECGVKAALPPFIVKKKGTIH